jgi:hypothetical protein
MKLQFCNEMKKCSELWRRHTNGFISNTFSYARVLWLWSRKIHRTILGSASVIDTSANWCLEEAHAVVIVPVVSMSYNFFWWWSFVLNKFQTNIWPKSLCCQVLTQIRITFCAELAIMFLSYKDYIFNSNIMLSVVFFSCKPLNSCTVVLLVPHY